jgi:hypothetical protein
MFRCGIEELAGLRISTPLGRSSLLHEAPVSAKFPRMSIHGENFHMKEEGLDTGLKTRIIFDYYKREREEFANLSRERTSLSLQFLVILGALSYAFFQSSSVIFKFGISAAVVALGLLGLMTNISLEREMRMHVARARAARRHLDFLQEFVDAKPESLQSSKGIRQDKLYFAIMILVMIVGLVFALTLIIK